MKVLFAMFSCGKKKVYCANHTSKTFNKAVKEPSRYLSVKNLWENVDYCCFCILVFVTQNYTV